MFPWAAYIWNGEYYITLGNAILEEYMEYHMWCPKDECGLQEDT